MGDVLTFLTPGDMLYIHCVNTVCDVMCVEAMGRYGVNNRKYKCVRQEVHMLNSNINNIWTVKEGNLCIAQSYQTTNIPIYLAIHSRHLNSN